MKHTLEPLRLILIEFDIGEFYEIYPFSLHLLVYMKSLTTTLYEDLHMLPRVSRQKMFRTDLVTETRLVCPVQFLFKS
jgi:hypothetical protein